MMLLKGGIVFIWTKTAQHKNNNMLNTKAEVTSKCKYRTQYSLAYYY